LAQTDAGSFVRVIVKADNGVAPAASAPSATSGQVDGPPHSTSAPTITGTDTVGSTLTASSGTWTGPPTPTGADFTYSWEDCDTAGNNCTTVQTGPANTRLLASADAGGTVRVVVTADNGFGTGTSQPSAATAVIDGPPRVTAVPTISGTAQQGQTLTASTGTWVGPPPPTSYSYVWSRCDGSGNNCQPIATGGTSQHYTATSDDVGHELEVQVTALNTVGHTAANSAPSEPVSIAPPFNNGLPNVTGTVQQGQTLSTSNGVWANGPSSFAYGWEQCDTAGNACTRITIGAFASTYVPVAGDVGHTLRSVVTAHNSSGDTSSESSQTTTVLIAPPAPTDLPQLSGSAVEGESVSGSQGEWANTPTTYAYQWLQCDASGNVCAPILGADASTYAPTITDVGHTLRLTISATNAGGSTTVTSGPSAIVEGLAASVPPPIFQQSANLSSVSGTILIKLPGSDTFVALTNAIDVPDGSTIDATNGTVSLTVQLPNGTYQTGQFYSGQFTVGQTKTGTVDAKLSGGSFSGCKAGKTHGARAAAGANKKKKPGTVVRQLWGNAHGNYTTKGRYGSASVSGTVWLTQDRCNGTFFKALKDDVYVIAFAHPHKRHHLKQGQTFFIPAH
jgi:hypothetical protein